MNRRAWLLLALPALASGCQRVPDGPGPLQIKPNWGPSTADTPVTILGNGFFVVAHANYDDPEKAALDRTFAARLGTYPLSKVTWRATNELAAVVPAGLPRATHDLVVTDPRGREGTLPHAFTVTGEVDAGRDAVPDRVGDQPREGGCAAAWWNTTWTRRQKISIDASSVSSDLSSFPLVVRLDLSAHAAGDFLAAGTDVRFVSATGAELPYETELWDSTAKLAWLWVSVPSILAAGSGQHFWIYFRNASPAPRASAPVWDSDFVGVWHLQTDPTGGKGAVKDSSQLGSHGTASGVVAGDRGPARIGPGYTFKGQSHVRIPSTATGPLAVTQLTLEGWVWLDSSVTTPLDLHTVVARQLGKSWQDSYTLLVQDNPILVRFQTYPDTASSSLLGKNAWKHLAGVRDSNTLHLYIDGVEVAKVPATAAVMNDANDVTIGGEENDADTTVTECWSGMLDEVRISRAARSASWIAASYRSGAGTLVSLGPVERCGD